MNFFAHYRFKRKSLIFWVSLIVALILARAFMPMAVTSYVNHVLQRIPNYQGNIKEVDIHLWRGAYQIHDLRLNKKSGEVFVPFFSCPTLDLSVQWKALFDGALVGELVFDQPELNFVDGPTPGERQLEINGSWQDRLRELFPLQINRFEIRNGTITFRNPDSKPPVDLRMESVNVLGKNLTNSEELNRKLQATVHATGRVLKEGFFKMDLALNLLEKQPTFDLDAEVRQVPVTELNNFLLAYGNVDAESGQFDLFTEAVAEKGEIKGYIKPFFRNFTIFRPEENFENPLQAIWESIVGLTTALFQNQPKEQLATRIPFEGRIKDPNVNFFELIGNILRNAFIRALALKIDESVSIKDWEKSKDLPSDLFRRKER
ncbi:MAG: DUF748 domain-containing protein [Verrucomicrobiae bacterium]|nr:DUF748 domain-containing protein [Verrucomicrobiae bacterium]